MARINWRQVGDDFRQKYEGTFCRYVSPLSFKQEVCLVTSVESFDSESPRVELFNSRVGELSLKYDGHGELDFEFPPVRYFQSGNKALFFFKNHERQWKKGVCSGTSRIIFPYNKLYNAWNPPIDETTLADAYASPTKRNLTEGIQALEGDFLSVVLNDTFAIGHGNKKGDYILWFEQEPVALVTNALVKVEAAHFKQEILDFVRDTNDARTVI